MGMIFNVERFALEDGPGIRTVVFLKGCPLNCPWCHNPESKSPRPQLAYFQERCVGCGACGFCEVHSFRGEHKVDYKRCTACGECAKVCLHGALKIYGYEAGAQEIVALVMRDATYYKESGGGLTISGGEPLTQPAFTMEILRLAKERGVHTAIETSGYAPRACFEAVLPYCDLFLYDYKADARNHKRLMGVSRELIDDNLAFLLGKGARVILRCPIVPGVNDDEAALQAYVAQFPQLDSVEKLPYHSMGIGKGRAIGIGI